MTAQIPDFAPTPFASLADFLRHVERRAAVLAELACGDRARGDAAVAAAMRALCSAVARAGAVAQGATPALHAQFWSLLLAAPQLRRPAPEGHWPAELAVLAALQPGTRAALLLRLVAGLDDAQAARALRVPPDCVRRALAGALARSAATTPLPASWDTTARAIECHVRQLPAQRLAHLAAARERALSGVEAPTRARGLAPRWRWAAMSAVAGACALGFAATFLPGRMDGDPRIAMAALPAADAPASTYDDETAVLTHPDFEQLADTRDAAVVRELDFYAWYAAQLASSGAATPVLLPDAARPAPATPAGPPHASP